MPEELPRWFLEELRNSKNLDEFIQNHLEYQRLEDSISFNIRDRDRNQFLNNLMAEKMMDSIENYEDIIKKPISHGFSDVIMKNGKWSDRYNELISHKGFVFDPFRGAIERKFKYYLYGIIERDAKKGGRISIFKKENGELLTEFFIKK